MAGFAQVGVLLVLLAAAWRPLGDWMARVYTDERDWRVERAPLPPGARRPALRAAGGHLRRRGPRVLVRRDRAALPAAAPAVVAAVVVRPRDRGERSDGEAGGVEPGIAFNTAISFVTNTNWQSYVPETTMGHAVAMAGLTVQNFVSAAVGMAVAVALVRGFVRSRTDRLGNAWVDIVRGCTRDPAADRRRRRGRARRPRRRDEPAGGGRRRRSGRAPVDDRAGAGGLAGGDQAARHQRRRHPQRQLRAPVREPEPGLEPARDLPDAGRSRCR